MTRDLGLKLISAADVLVLAGAIVWLVLLGAWIAGLVAAVAAFVGGVLFSAWVIGVQNSPRSGVYK